MFLLNVDGYAVPFSREARHQVADARVGDLVVVKMTHGVVFHLLIGVDDEFRPMALVEGRDFFIEGVPGGENAIITFANPEVLELLLEYLRDA